MPTARCWQFLLLAVFSGAGGCRAAPLDGPALPAVDASAEAPIIGCDAASLYDASPYGVGTVVCGTVRDCPIGQCATYANGQSNCGPPDADVGSPTSSLACDGPEDCKLGDNCWEGLDWSSDKSFIFLTSYCRPTPNCCLVAHRLCHTACDCVDGEPCVPAGKPASGLSRCGLGFW